MNAPASGPASPGWFGKIPSLGDFATRRLPATFIEPWHQWLSAELSEARLMLGDSWPAIYEAAPISCFSLGPGTVDDCAWHGIVVPSHDRVGRRFPLTIALARRPHESASLSRPWWTALVASGRRALEQVCGADGVEAALEVFAAAPEVPNREPEPTTLEAGTSTWWAWSEDSSDAVSCLIHGLPRAACFRKLLGAAAHEPGDPSAAG